MRLGFVGLGLMGVPMVRNLFAAGIDPVVYSASAESRKALAAEGLRTAASLRDVVTNVDVLCSCRVTAEQSRAVFLGPDGALAAGRSGLLCIDFATLDPACSREIAAELGERGIAYLDAPISGGPGGAAARTLSIIVGGEAADLDRARPVLEAVGKRMFHMGPVGAGNAAKLCNNLVTIATHVLLAEAMVLGAKAGIDPRRLYEVMSASSASSNTLERVVPNHFLTRNFTAAASITTVMKDLQSALDTASILGVPLTLGAVALQRLADAAAQGLGESDIAAVILPIETAAGIKVGPS